MTSMTVKEAMTAYFARAIASGPLIAPSEAGGKSLFVGKPKEGAVEWKPQEKLEQSDFGKIERKAKTELHSSVKDYYNAYWFLTLAGKIGEHFVSLNPVIPKVALKELEKTLFGAVYGPYRTSGYIEAHGGVLTQVPIGLHSPSDLVVVVDNRTGAVCVEDHETDRLETIAASLAELIVGLK
jgi:SecY interacting protein Syd